MRYFFDTLLGKLVVRPGYSGLLSSASHKRGDSAMIEVQPCEGNEAGDLGEPTEMVYVIKQSFAVDAPALAWANEWEKDEETGIWRSQLVASAALSPLLGALEKLALKGEFTVTSTKLGTLSSQTLSVILDNDLWKGIEGTPMADPDPEAWLEARRPAPLALSASLPISAALGDSGYLVMENAGIGGLWPAGVALGDYFEFTADGVTERWTLASPADPEVDFEFQADDDWEALLTNFVDAINARSSLLEAALNTGPYQIWLAPKVAADVWSFTSSTVAWPESIQEITGSSAGTPADGLGQACIVEHSDGSYSEWAAVSLAPYRWQPRTAGIILNRNTNLWERLFVNASTLAIETEVLPDQS